jgi:hypothetical protein
VGEFVSQHPQRLRPLGCFLVVAGTEQHVIANGHRVRPEGGRHLLRRQITANPHRVRVDTH